jgi:hypothetical protein
MKAPIVFIESRQHPLCDVPEIGIGNKPIDDGNYLFTEEEKEEFIEKEPNSGRWFRPWVGSDEFINGYTRFCLFLKNCPPNELRKMPEVVRRVNNVRNFRLASKSRPTQKLAETPTHFHVENVPDSNFIIIPRVSSEKRRYIPIGFATPDIVTSDSVLMIPGATLYHFGILTSSVHMAWVRVVCGRLKSDYRYSKDIVYNNFPWPNVTGTQRGEISKLAQVVLDVRRCYSDCSLADLYDPVSMPSELLRAHQNLDKAVLKLYGFKGRGMPSDEECVAMLMGMYKNLV